ncbi:LysR family transcriptional regulator [Microbacterium jejuense]|uniref:LysR family transcriptional regulator n=1 Tax=Microbacterium jejuense TaxID=1263637 RepID=A0ABS7HTD8_9MICO|nr:LysR family transcriptional regulator [Microbacterium jejuense]MBW9095289.1 LysR family transcriptional regulator [Microbacterium jejuense]
MGYVPDVESLRLLRAVFETGSISAAARERGVTQQSASARLRAMERALGLELLLRSPHGVTATPAGEVFASWADDLLHAADRLETGVDQLRGESGRELAVAASQTVAAHLLPHWLVTLRTTQLAAGRQPTEVRLLTANSADTCERVRSGAASIGFIESPEPLTDLWSRVVARDELVVVVATDHPWASRDTVGLDEVAATGLVARERGSGTRRAWELVVEGRLGHPPAEPALVLANAAAIRSAVASGLAPAVLSSRVVADDLRLGRLAQVAVATDPILRPITAIWRGTPRDLAPVARELLEAARAT